MNYTKIYEDLIASRSVRPKLQGVYYERHHIIARCQGGSDEPENLIYLTAEEHYIAHMLMAKIYGGWLWQAAYLMSQVSPTHDRKVVNRHMVGVARRKSAEQRQDQTVYKLRIMATGEIVEHTQLELQSVHGLASCESSLLVNGKVNHAKGLCMVGYVKPSEQQHKFVNIHTREQVSASCTIMSKHTGKPSSIFYNIVSGVSLTMAGWTLHTVPYDKVSVHLNTYIVLNVYNGEKITGNRKYFSEQLKLPAGTVTKILRGEHVDTCHYLLVEGPIVPEWWSHMQDKKDWFTPVYAYEVKQAYDPKPVKIRKVKKIGLSPSGTLLTWVDRISEQEHS